MEKNKKIWIGIIAIGILAASGLTIALASFSQTLNVSNKAQIDPRTFGIEFGNLGNSSRSSNAEIITPAVLSSSSVSGLKVKLPELGSQITYTFDIVNTGSYDAEIGTITYSTPNCTGTGDSAAADETLVCGNIVFKLEYTQGGAALTSEDTLLAGQTKKVTMTVGYSAAASLPEGVVEINDLNVSVIYVQSQ